MKLAAMMDPAELDVICAFLRPEHVMFEFGSGGSTGEWARRVKKVYAAEHIAVWADRVREALAAENITNAQVVSRPPDMDAFERLFSGCTKRGITEPGELPDWCSPNFDAKWREAPTDHRVQVFKDYVGAIGSVGESRFDVVLVDSRCRGECALAALPYVSVNSYVIIHDWNLEEEGPVEGGGYLKLPPRKALPSYERVLEFYDVVAEVSPKTHPDRCSRCGLVVLRKKLAN
ncbi:hypothetical protein CTAYLR_008808 [Chrysophaeum taylorii]|uniref:Uncharacterized protein n=1 Tax=Chrysophaeum taylorii TaxID=2483200 RepID=A0AAD7UCX3_9STRA|nr:hypothetical protein CTAYLR_008808 [Chrysophaeum taylorii]